MHEIKDLKSSSPASSGNGICTNSKEPAQINAVGAWPLTRGSKEVKIVVFDTGVDVIHPNLHPNIVLEDARDFDHSLEDEVKLGRSEINELRENAAAA